VQNAEEARAVVFTSIANELYFGNLEYKNITCVYLPFLIFSSRFTKAKKMMANAHNARMSPHIVSGPPPFKMMQAKHLWHNWADVDMTMASCWQHL